MLRFLFVRLGTGLLLGSLLAFAFGQSNSVEKSAKAILEANCLTCHGDAPNFRSRPARAGDDTEGRQAGSRGRAGQC